jgi:ribokinase
VSTGGCMSTGGRPSIWVVGSTMIDMVAYVRAVPRPGETVVGERFELGFGGKGANQAVMAAALGADVSMVNCLGDDVFGSMTLDNFRSRGIDARHVVTAAGVSSGVAPIWVEPDGTNRIIVIPGANDRMTPQGAARAIGEADRMDLVIGQLEIPQAVTRAAFEAARARPAIRVLNPAPAAPIDPGLLKLTDWLVPNEIEFTALASHLGLARADATDATDATDAATLAGVEEAIGTRLVVTLGERGAVFRDASGKPCLVEPPSVHVVDTTGAGDAFVGAFAFGLALGWQVIDAVRLGCACAASSVERPGTQKSFPGVGDFSRVAAWAGVPAWW